MVVDATKAEVEEEVAVPETEAAPASAPTADSQDAAAEKKAEK